MRVGVIGLSHKSADLQSREEFVKNCQQWFKSFSSFAHYFDEATSFVFLPTCQRVEIYFSSPHLEVTYSCFLKLLQQEVGQEYAAKTYVYFEENCFWHLVRVITGLDSPNRGEKEIQIQVKVAYEAARKERTLGKDLHFIFQKGLRIAKKVRYALEFEKCSSSLEEALLNIGYHFFENFSYPKILFIGASEINQKILKYFKSKVRNSITLCNRSIKGKKIAFDQDLLWLEWDQLTSWIDYDWIIIGTKSPDYLLECAHLLPQKAQSKKLLIDLSVPRNIDPQMNEKEGIRILNIEQIQPLVKHATYQKTAWVEEAESLVQTKVQAEIVRYFYNCSRSTTCSIPA